ncbi:terminase large subunit [Emticicia fontis]
MHVKTKNELDTAFKYAQDVQDGKIEACKWVKLAVKRFYDDLEKGEARNLWFDYDRAQADLSFYDFVNIKQFEQVKDRKGNIVTRSKYDPFILQPWQSFIKANLYGFMQGDVRRFTESCVCVSRKNGKSTDAASFGLKALMFDDEVESNVFCAATKKDQARIVFDEAKKIIRISPNLREFFSKDDLTKDAIAFQETDSKFQPMSSDANTLDGLNPHATILDETHEYKNSGLYDIFVSAMGSRLQPILYQISTAGFHKDYWFYEYLMNLLQILEGKYLNDNVFVIYYTLDNADEIYDPTKWIKANPNLGVSVLEKYLRDQVNQMIQIPGRRTGVLTKNFNMFVDSSETWIASELWEELTHVDRLNEVGIKKVWGGIDGASSRDIYAFSLLFHLVDDTYFIKHKFFIAEQQLNRLPIETKGLFEQWIRDGWLTTTEGKTIDTEHVELEIAKSYKEYSEYFAFIGYDPYRLTDTVKRLNAELPEEYIFDEKKGDYVLMERLQPVNQNLLNMSAPSAHFQHLIENKQMFHDGSPVMSWMMGNVELIFDSNLNFKPDRKNAKKKIDGVMSTLDAIKLKLAYTEVDEEDDKIVTVPKKKK